MAVVRDESAAVPAARCVHCERLLIVSIPPDAPDAELAFERVVCAPCAWREAAAATGTAGDAAVGGDAG
jgi:hypothetical protein